MQTIRQTLYHAFIEGSNCTGGSIRSIIERPTGSRKPQRVVLYKEKIKDISIKKRV
jgi:hypothetical protein